MKCRAEYIEKGGRRYYILLVKSKKSERLLSKERRT